MATLWETVDEPVLRWVASLPPSLGMEIYEFAVDDPETFEAIPGVDSRQVNESLHRLLSYELIDGGPEPPTARVDWTRLRITAKGLIALGEWPDLDRIATVATVHRLLRSLADEAPESERSVLRKAAGAVTRAGDEALRGTATDIARGLGRDLGRDLG